jgi:acyl carrier protein
MNQRSTEARVASTIEKFVSSLGRDCPTLSDDSDLHRHLGLSSDEGVLLVIEIGEEFNVELPEDFNAVIDDSGKRGRSFQQLVDKVGSFLKQGAKP